MVTGFHGTDAVEAIETVDCEVRREGTGREFSPQPGTERMMPADLVLLAIGFDGVACESLVEGLGGHLTEFGGDRRRPGLLRRPRGVRGRRRHPRGLADRLGDRRGAEGGSGLRPVPGRFALRAAGGPICAAGPAERGPADG